VRDELGPHVGRDRPADDATAEHVQDDDEHEESRLRPPGSPTQTQHCEGTADNPAFRSCFQEPRRVGLENREAVLKTRTRVNFRQTQRDVGGQKWTARRGQKSAAADKSRDGAWRPAMHVLVLGK
jgi:hypothetical protein